MTKNFNVIIDIDPGFFPFGVFICSGGNRLKGRLINFQKQAFASRIKFLKFPIIEFNQSL